jgi:hypothetical protein
LGVLCSLNGNLLLFSCPIDRFIVILPHRAYN